MVKIDFFKGRYVFLSNFYPCEIIHQGITYPSVEHYYVAMKSNNEQLIDGVYYTTGDFREMISKIKSPSLAKKIGKKIKLRKNWDVDKFKFMDWGVTEKFKDNKLAELLLSTGNSELIEGNWWHDNTYGSCTCEKCGNKGRNYLGKLLMNIREDLRGNKKGIII